MRKYHHIKSFKTLLLVALIGASSTFVMAHTHAQSVSTNVNLDWINGASSCYGTANGQPQAYYGAVAGDTISLHVTNVSTTYSISVDISETGQNTYSTILAPGSSVSPTLPVNSEISLQANGSVCTSGHGGPGFFGVEAASGSMSCSLQNNQVWQVSLNFSHVVGTSTMYRGNTLVDTFSNTKGSVLDFPVGFSAQSSAATYYIYSGSDSSGRLLGQANCPAKTVSPPSVTPPATIKPTNSPAPATTDNTATATSPTDTVQLTAIYVAGKPVPANKTLQFNQSQSLKLTGHTTANSLVTLTIHSTPKTATVSADASGIWSYTVGGLAPGNHYIEATVTDPTTKQVSAATRLVAFKINTLASSAVKPPANNTKFIILGVIALIALALGVALVLMKKKNFLSFRKPSKDNKTSPSDAIADISQTPDVDTEKENSED